MAIEEPLSEYDDLADDAARSKHEFFRSNLQRWFRYVDNTPELSRFMEQIEGSIDFEEWTRDGLVKQSGVGNGKIVLPEDEVQRLGALTGLFRSLTEDDDAAWRFASEFISYENNLDVMISELVDQLYEPYVRDLRRQFRRMVNSSEAGTIPASDRVVTLNHNEQPYQDVIQAIDKLSEALRQANDYDDPDDKAQREAELAAGKELLKAPRVREDGLLSVLGKALRYLWTKFRDNAVGQAAKWTIEKLIALIPALWSFFSSLLS